MCRLLDEHVIHDVLTSPFYSVYPPFPPKQSQKMSPSFLQKNSLSGRVTVNCKVRLCRNCSALLRIALKRLFHGSYHARLVLSMVIATRRPIMRNDRVVWTEFDLRATSCIRIEIGLRSRRNRVRGKGVYMWGKITRTGLFRCNRDSRFMIRASQNTPVGKCIRYVIFVHTCRYTHSHNIRNVHGGIIRRTAS